MGVWEDESFSGEAVTMPMITAKGVVLFLAVDLPVSESVATVGLLVSGPVAAVRAEMGAQPLSTKAMR